MERSSFNLLYNPDALAAFFALTLSGYGVISFFAILSSSNTYWISSYLVLSSWLTAGFSPFFFFGLGLSVLKVLFPNPSFIETPDASVVGRPTPSPIVGEFLEI